MTYEQPTIWECTSCKGRGYGGSIPHQPDCRYDCRGYVDVTNPLVTSTPQTLLERRRDQMNEQIEWLLNAAETLRKCRDGKYDDLTMRVITLGEIAANAVKYARLVDDLEDVEKYGPGGGR